MLVGLPWLSRVMWAVRVLWTGHAVWRLRNRVSARRRDRGEFAGQELSGYGGQELSGFAAQDLDRGPQRHDQVAEVGPARLLRRLAGPLRTRYRGHPGNQGRLGRAGELDPDQPGIARPRVPPVRLRPARVSWATVPRTLSGSAVPRSTVPRGADVPRSTVPRDAVPRDAGLGGTGRRASVVCSAAMRPGLARHGGGGESVQQVVRVERDDPLVALEVGGHRLHRPGPAVGLRLDDDRSRAERQPDRAGPLRDQRHPAHGLGERPGRARRRGSRTRPGTWTGT